MRISFTPGRGVGDEVEGAGQRTESGDQRDLELEAQVLLERLLGVHRHGEEARRDLALGSNDGGADLEEVGQVALGVDLADEGALALLGGQQGQRRGDRRLADAALAGDEEQPAVEQVDGQRIRRPGQPPKPMRRPSSGLPIST